jgi:hypothetical protein
MDAAPDDVVTAIALTCSYTCVLALSQVNRRTNSICEKAWNRLYERDYRCVGGKNDYKRMKFSTGVVVRYDGTGKVTPLQIDNVKRYVQLWGRDVSIDGVNQLTVNGVVLTEGVVDMDYIGDHLWVLTKHSVIVYVALDEKLPVVVADTRLTGGVRIVCGPFDHAVVELENGTTLTVDASGSVDYDKKYAVYYDFVFGHEPIHVEARAYNVETLADLVILRHDKVYLIADNRVIAVPIQPEHAAVAISGDDVLLVTTKNRELVAVDTKTGLCKIVDTNVITTSLTQNAYSIYYVRLAL